MLCVYDPVPGAPSFFKVSALDLDSLTLEWGPPHERNGRLSGYTFKYQTGEKTCAASLRFTALRPVHTRNRNYTVPIRKTHNRMVFPQAYAASQHLSLSFIFWVEEKLFLRVAFIFYVFIENSRHCCLRNEKLHTASVWIKIIVLKVIPVIRFLCYTSLVVEWTSVFT